MYNFSLITYFLCLTLFAFSSTEMRNADVEGDSDTKWYSLKEAQKLAKVQEKKVLVYVYTQNNHQCERMSYSVYSSETVSNIIHEHYFASKINAKSDDTVIFNNKELTEREFAQKFNVSSYPTIIFLDSRGEVITLQGGFIEKQTFTKLLVFVGTDAYKRQEFDQFTYRKEN